MDGSHPQIARSGGSGGRRVSRLEPVSGEPFLSAEAERMGVSRGQLRGPRVLRLFPGVHVLRPVEPTLPTLVAGARRLLPADASVTGTPALRMHQVPAGPWRPLHFVTTHPHQVRRPGLRVTRTATLPVGSVGVVTAPWSFVSSASQLDLVELVAAGDRLVRSGWTTPDELLAVSAAFRGRGARAARRAAALVRTRVDSAQETELRLCLVLAGLPEPECNPVVGSGEAIGRVDLRYRTLRVVLEYEGDQHRTDRSKWNRDIQRHEQLTADGWSVVRITAERMRNPYAVVARTVQALRSAGYPGPDPVFSAEWRLLFSATARSRRLRHAFAVLESAVDPRAAG